jgi:hypothetical protein
VWFLCGTPYFNKAGEFNSFVNVLKAAETLVLFSVVFKGLQEQEVSDQEQGRLHSDVDGYM